MPDLPPRRPFVNVHTHIFLARDVPIWIARKMIWWPFYYIAHLPFWIAIYNGLRRSSQNPDGLIFRFRLGLHRLTSWMRSSGVSSLIWSAFLAFVVLQATAILVTWFNIENTWLNLILQKLSSLTVVASLGWPAHLALIMLALILSRHSRRLLLSVVGLVFQLPDSTTFRFFQRYLLILNLARYKTQNIVFGRLHKMYPEDAHFVVLPMDMAFMKAGPCRSYLQQLNKLNYLKQITTNEHYKNLIPFLHCDPRRIRNRPYPKPFFYKEDNVSGSENLLAFAVKEERERRKNVPFFTWKYAGGKIILDNDTIVKYCLEENTDRPLHQNSGNFKGIKIYPALGYYPFDPALLPLWLYCVQENIPILSHCVLGTIFYRGRIRSKWFTHPVFRREDGTGLKTFVKSNEELQRNFTHPLNYLVLLDDTLLQEYLVSLQEDDQVTKDDFIKLIQAFYGVSPEKITERIEHGDLAEYLLDEGNFRSLRSLKINLAHYGGVNEWKQYLERDRQEESQEVIELPELGVRFFQSQNGKQEKRHKPADFWYNLEWFTIISSLMLQYPNVYADLSYIIHSGEIMPQLTMNLRNPKLSQKILFGTDFYVVRNHKSEKAILAELYHELGEEEIDLIARTNPHNYLEEDLTEKW